MYITFTSILVSLSTLYSIINKLVLRITNFLLHQCHTKYRINIIYGLLKKIFSFFSYNF